MIYEAWHRWVRLKWGLFAVCCIVTIFISTQNILISGKPDKNGGLTMKYDNYRIFKFSHFNLIEGKDLYKKHAGQAADYFKYSPSFALIFGIIAYLPDYIGLNIWNLINVLVLFFAILSLPNLDDKSKVFILLFILLELITSIQNSQSNCLIAGLLVFSFVLLEKGKFIPATLLIVSTAFIKIFGIITILLLLFYPNKKNAIFYSFLWGIVICLLPIISVGANHLFLLYKSWYNLLAADYSASVGTSVNGFLMAVTQAKKVNNAIILVLATILLLLPLLRKGKFNNFNFRLLYLCAILIWMIIFNHRAESPTFAIAMTGVGLWFFSQENTKINITLVIIAFLFTTLCSTDLIPMQIKDTILFPYKIKAIPCIMIWIKITFDLSFGQLRSERTSN